MSMVKGSILWSTAAAAVGLLIVSISLGEPASLPLSDAAQLNRATAMSVPDDGSVATSSGGETIPLMINHQGVITVNGARFNGIGQFNFAIVDSNLNTNVWTNDDTNEGTSLRPLNSVSLAVASGLYTVRLGDAGLANMTDIPIDVFTGGVARSLRIWFNDGTNNVLQLTPDHPLTSSPFAYCAANAAFAASVPANSGAIVGEVRMWGGPIAAIPPGWLFCNGEAKLRAEYPSLFAAIGTIYGAGDGVTTFLLPDSRDRSPMGARQDVAGVPRTNVSGSLTQIGGAATHQLTEAQMPSHKHTMRAQTDFVCDGSGSQSPAGNCLGNTCIAGPFIYSTLPPNTSMHSSSILDAGGDDPHPILDPYFAITFIVFAGS